MSSQTCLVAEQVRLRQWVAKIQLFDKIIERNAWIQYYRKCEAEIDG